MKIELANNPSSERYVVELDGMPKSEYCVFVKALTAGLQLRAGVSKQPGQVARC